MYSNIEFTPELQKNLRHGDCKLMSLVPAVILEWSIVELQLDVEGLIKEIEAVKGESISIMASATGTA